MSDEVASPLSRATLIRRIAQSVVTRLAEIGLAVIGIAYINSPDTADAESTYLGYFNLLALVYLITGFFVVRRHRRRTTGPPPMLLHVGYAKFYRSLDAAAGSPGLRFPDNTDPMMLDYLYFAITLGVSFAVSDVDVMRRDTRWHVLVHGVVSFFYNSAVLAVAVGVVTRK